MDHTQLPHYHIRWSGKATLDWEVFGSCKEAEATAKQLVRQKETYTIEEHDGTCLRCRAAMNLKSEHGTSKGASA
jgi:hypothetical protein